MKSYRYVGQSDTITLTPEDFSRHAIDEPDEDIVFSRENDWTVELTDDQVALLRANGYRLEEREKYDERMAPILEQQERDRAAYEATLTPLVSTKPEAPDEEGDQDASEAAESLAAELDATEAVEASEQTEGQPAGEQVATTPSGAETGKTEAKSKKGRRSS